MNAPEHVRRLLEGRAIKNALTEYWSKIGTGEGDEHIEHCRLGHRMRKQELLDVFSRCLRQELPRPHPITVENLYDAWTIHALPSPDSDFDQSYARFVDTVIGQMLNGPFQLTSEPFIMGFLPRLSAEFTFTEPESLYSNECGMSIEAVGTHHVGGGHRDVVAMHDTFPFLINMMGGGAYLYGLVSCWHASLEAIVEAAAEARNVLRTLFRCVHMAGLSGNSTSDDDAHAAESQSRTIDFVRWSLQAYYSKLAGKKSSIQPRILNAIDLLAEADRTEHLAVSVALCCSTLEALLSTKKEAISDELSRRIATLLESNAHERRAIMKAVKDVYDARSRVLHGTDVEVDQFVYHRARLYAAWVLHAIWEWSRSTQRIGENGLDAGQFFEQLQDAEVGGRRMVGVSYSYWESENPNDNE